MIREAVGDSVVLRADANQRWSLEEAVAFGMAAVPAGLEYVEEPTKDPWDMPAFFEATGKGLGRGKMYLFLLY